MLEWLEGIKILLQQLHQSPVSKGDKKKVLTQKEMLEDFILKGQIANAYVVWIVFAMLNDQHQECAQCV